jgi:thiol-disulfide isomerase/thioredoxin
MKKLLLFAAVFTATSIFGQTVYWEENFDAFTAGGLDATWSQSGTGWSVNTPAALSSQYFTVPAATGNVLGINDDAVQTADYGDEFVSSPAVDLSAAVTPYLMFDMYFFAGAYNGVIETLTLETSVDGGATWVVLQDAPVGNGGGWQTFAIDLASFVGQSSIQFGMRYGDGGEWLYGAAVDNIKVLSPDLSVIDASIISTGAAVEIPAVPALSYSFSRYLTGESVLPAAVVSNNEFAEITSFDVSYTVGGNTVTESVTGQSLGYGETYLHQFAAPVTLVGGANTISFSVSNVNNGTETVTDNNAGDDVAVEGITPFPGRVILGEEGTGTWCGWCPRGAVYMDYLAEKYPDHFAGIAVHNADPMTVTAYDAAMANAISGYPSGLVDRATFNGAAEVDPQDFEAAMMERLDVDPGVVITNSLVYNAATEEYTVTRNFAFSQAITGTLRVATVLIEDNVTGTAADYAQTNYYSGGGNGLMGGYESLGGSVPAADMVYHHVARHLEGGFTGATGVIATGQATAGANISNDVIIPGDASWDPANIKAITFIIKSNVVVNAGMSEGSVAVNELPAAEGFSIYPNPSAQTSFIRLASDVAADAVVTLIDATGRIVENQNYQNLSAQSLVPVNTAVLGNGMYLVRVDTNGKTYTSNLIVNH